MARRLVTVTCAIALVTIGSGFRETNRNAIATPNGLGYVGRVTGTPAYVGIVVRAGQAIAYVCDGHALARWFKGTSGEGSFVLESAAGDELTVRLTDAGARGVLRIPGTPPHSFLAPPAKGRAGLYRVEQRVHGSASTTQSEVVSGWVRLNDGSIRGASLTSPLRVLHPAPDIEVQLLPAQPPSIAPAGELPQLGNRQTSLASPVCRATTGPGCGLPLAVPPPVRNTPARIVARPAQIHLSQAALSALTAGIDDAFERARTAFLRRAGQTEPRLPPAVQAAANAAAAAMRADPALLAAAEQLRRARTAAETTAKLALYANLLKPYTGWLTGAGRGFDLASVHSTGGGTPAPTNVEHSLTGPWLIIDHSHGNGDWETSNALQRLSAAGDVLTLNLHARAGFNSDITYTRYAIVFFDVPPGATNVEVEIDRSSDAYYELDACGGDANGLTWEGYMVYRSGSNGINLGDDPVSGGYDLYDITVSTGETECGFGPILPDPDVLQAAEPPLPFVVPSQGGEYALVVVGEADATMTGGGTAVTELTLAIDGVTLRYRA